MPLPHLDRLLSEFNERVEDAAHSVAVSGDGLLMAASKDLAPARADQLAAIVAGLVSLAHGLADAVDGGPVLRTIVHMQRHLLLVMAIGDGETLASLATLTVPACDVGQVAFEMANLARRVGEVLTPAPR